VLRDDDPSGTLSLRSSLHASTNGGDSERAALLSEKLQHSKRKNAELRTQLASLESELAQMTMRVQQLHGLHASSSADLVAQTKHACEAAAARQAAEAEARHKHEASVARQVAAEALDAERAFRNDVGRRVRTVEEMFPEAYADSRQQQFGAAAAATAAHTSSDHPHQSLSASQSHFSAFLESTRRALHSSQQLQREVREAQAESRSLRARAPIDAEFQYGVTKAAQQMGAKVVELQEQMLGSGERRSASLGQRDDILARVDDIEAWMQQQRARAHGHAAASAPTVARAASSALAAAAAPSGSPSPPPATVSFDDPATVRSRVSRGSRSAGPLQRRRVQLPPTRDDEQRADEAAMAAEREADQRADRQVAHAEHRRVADHVPSRRWTGETGRDDGAQQEEEEEEEQEENIDPEARSEDLDDSAATDEQCDVVPSLRVSGTRSRYADV